MAIRLPSGRRQRSRPHPCGPGWRRQSRAPETLANAPHVANIGLAAVADAEVLQLIVCSSERYDHRCRSALVHSPGPVDGMMMVTGPEMRAALRDDLR